MHKTNKEITSAELSQAEDLADRVRELHRQVTSAAWEIDSALSQIRKANASGGTIVVDLERARVAAREILDRLK